jgi:hypothetical protein
MLPIVALCTLAPTATSAQKARDLSKLDACKVLTPADVSGATKHKLMTSVGGAVHCSYVVEDPNRGADTYDFYLTEATVMEALIGVKSAKEKGTSVAGLWNEAYVGPAIGSSNQLSLVALHRGDMAIEIHGPSKDVLIALARIAVGRLK